MLNEEESRLPSGSFLTNQLSINDQRNQEAMEQLDLEMQDRDWEGLSSGEETNMNILDLDNKEVRIVNDNSPELTTFKKLTKLSKGPKRTNEKLLEI